MQEVFPARHGKDHALMLRATAAQVAHYHVSAAGTSAMTLCCLNLFAHDPGGERTHLPWLAPDWHPT